MEHAVLACSVQYKANGQLGELLGFQIFLSQSLWDGCKWCTETVDSVWGCVPRGSRSWNLQKAKENEQDWCVFFSGVHAQFIHLLYRSNWGPDCMLLIQGEQRERWPDHSTSKYWTHAGRMDGSQGTPCIPAQNLYPEWAIESHGSNEAKATCQDIFSSCVRGR